MKNILLSTVALVGFTAAPMAADLPVRAAPPPMPVAVAPIFTWTGFYVGVNGASHSKTTTTIAAVAVVVGRGNRGNGGNEDSSILGGAQIGYNMPLGKFVAGIEADAQAIDFARINPILVPGRNNRINRNNDDEVDVFGTVRGRLGLAAFDRGLIYATGGLAWKSDEGTTGPRGNNSDNIGFTVGAGVEYGLHQHISMKVGRPVRRLQRGDNAQPPTTHRRTV
jgi:outer membrane immunogenic protein